MIMKTCVLNRGLIVNFTQKVHWSLRKTSILKQNFLARKTSKKNRREYFLAFSHKLRKKYAIPFTLIYCCNFNHVMMPIILIFTSYLTSNWYYSLRVFLLVFLARKFCFKISVLLKLQCTFCVKFNIKPLFNTHVFIII